MRPKNVVLPLVLIVVSVLFSCQHDKSELVRKAVLRGNIKLSDDEKVRLSNRPIPIEKEWSKTIDTSGISVNLDDFGNFEININIAEPDFYRLGYGTKSVEIYLEPNDSVSISIDSFPKFVGDNKALNQYFQDYEGILIKNENYIRDNLAGIYALDEIGFNKKLDSIKNDIKDQSNSLFEDLEEIPSSFMNRVIADNEYLIGYYKLLYPVGYESIRRTKATLSDNFFDKLSEGLNAPQFLNSANYVRYLDKYLEVMSAGVFKYERYDIMPLEKIQSRYNVIKKLHVDQKIKDYLFEQHFKNCNKYYSTKHWKTIYDDFVQVSKNDDLVDVVSKAYKTATALRQEPEEVRVYKTVGNIQLDAHIFYPDGHKNDNTNAAYLFFHGGGWSLGLPENGYTNCEKMVDKGVVAISFEYRLIDVHGNTIQKSLEDAKSAVRWVRANAHDLGIDPERIVASGFSAGAHLAASTAIIDDFVSEDNEDLSSIPNLIITQSSNYTAEGDFFLGVSKGQSNSVSLIEHVKSDLPPFLLLHASEDYIDPVYTFYQFKSRMEEYENDFEFKVFQGVDHFFSDEQARREVDDLINDFLGTRGYFDSP